MIDEATLFKPDTSTAVFLVARGKSHVDRQHWVVEANCAKPRENTTALGGGVIDARFVRGIGKEPFAEWPIEIFRGAIDRACNTTAASNGRLEHPLEGLTVEQRQQFMYSPDFDAEKLVKAVEFWGRQKQQ